MKNRPAKLSPLPKVMVAGSLNVDYIGTVEVLPAPGQTVAASVLLRRFGGKGANQAVAAARQGARVSLIGCVGADDEGRAYRRRLQREGIVVRGLTYARRALTGTALIAVDRRGENTIIVAPGANARLTPNLFGICRDLAPIPDALLLQFEIPMTTTAAAAAWANRAGVRVVLNPSPLRDGFPWGACQLDTLIVNAGEAEAIFRLPAAQIHTRAGAWRKALLKYRIDHLVITRGAQPTLCLSGTTFLQVPTLKVKPVDTVGAGDAFAGTLVTHRAAGLDLLQAIRLANCAGALTTLKPGAQEAIPNRATTQRAVRQLFGLSATLAST